MATLEMVACHKAGLLKLGQDPVDRRQPHLFAGVQHGFIDILSTHVSDFALLKKTQYLDTRQGRL